MALIVKRGQLPQTPHTEFYAVHGVLALEEIHGSYGFSGPYSRKTHIRSYPTEFIRPPQKGNFSLVARAATDPLLQPFHIQTGRIPAQAKDAIRARIPLIVGRSTITSVSKHKKSMDENVFFRNGEKHEIYFVQEGKGALKTEYGELTIRKGLYLVIPKGTTYQIDIASQGAYFFIVESNFPIQFPPHYLNRQGQATLMAPIVETEIEIPDLKPPHDDKGEFFIDVKHAGGLITRLTLGHHPFDVCGWEGALYPFGFDIKNHHGIAREIHTAPPMHQTFQSGNVPNNGFSLCSFVPQMEGWHLKDIPAPYAHYNVDSDEVMFFSNAQYGARRGIIEEGSLTFHPSALPHSPQGKAASRSLAARGKMSQRLAVMLDTYFEPLSITKDGYKYRDKSYALSWHKATRSGDNEPKELLHGT